jgi:hypothetical protein
MMSPQAIKDLLLHLGARVSEILDTAKIIADRYYQQKKAKCYEAREDPWLHYDDILRCNTIKQMGVYPGFEHYALLKNVLTKIK